MKTKTAPCTPTPRVAVEREVTLLPPTGLALPPLDDLVPHGAVTVLPRRRLDTTYYDTADLRLVRNGITLRHRSDDSGPAWTVKLPEGPRGPALARREIRFTGPSDRVPDQAVDLVLAVTRAEPLAAVARIHTARAATRLHDGNGRLLLEVDDDTVSVSTPKHHHLAFREVELDVDPATPDADTLLHTAVQRLTGAGCVAESPAPMLVRALGTAASAPPDVVVAPLRKPVTVPDLVQHSIARSVAQILRHDPGVRLGEDPEDVHQLRVGTRRLRSDLRTFARLLDAEPVAGIRSELGWLAALVGAVRDTDVLAARLRASSMALPGADSAAVGALLHRLARQASTARAAMLEAMRSGRYLDLIHSLVSIADKPPLADHGMLTARAPARVAARMAARPWRRLAGAATAEPAHPSDAELQRIRILAKRCRYAAEAVAPLVGPPAARFAAAIADVQTVLGDHQDTVFAEAWLRDAAGAEPDTGVAAGQLIAHERHQRDLMRARWPVVWRTASARKLGRWLEA